MFFLPIFTKGNNFIDILFASLDNVVFAKWDLLKMKEFARIGANTSHTGKKDKTKEESRDDDGKISLLRLKGYPFTMLIFPF